MTVHDRTEGLWAPRNGTQPALGDPPTQPIAVVDEPTLIDSYVVTTRPVAEGPGSGAPPEWTPPDAGTGSTGQPGKAGKHRAKLAVVGALVAAVAATAGITAAVVGSDDSSVATAGAAPGGGTQAFAGGGPGQGRAGGGTAAALHGTYVVSDGSGGYVTQETQTGTVSAVSSSSITVKSADGYSKTYVISSSTTVDNGADVIGDVKSGHTVRVVATTSGDTATATTVTDTDLATTTNQQGGTQQNGTGQGGPGGGAPMQGGQQQGGTVPQGTGT